MPDARDALEVLRFELDFVERGGYRRPDRIPARPVTFFQDSLTCRNFAAREPVHPCPDCVLQEFVVEKSRNEILPCHYIALNARGDCIATLDQGYNHPVVEQALVVWLRATIQRLEAERAALVETARIRAPGVAW